MPYRRGLVGSIMFVAMVVTGCGGTDQPATEPTATSAPPAPQFPYEDRFAAFEPAPEPNGDLAKVVWPEFVLQAPPIVKTLYEFQITHGDLMRYMPCFCGCGADGHRSNRDCYVRRVRAGGSVQLDSMAPT
jgi:hypothetical protein